MGKLLAHRLAALVPLLLIVSVATFSLVHLIPGDAAAFIAGDQASNEDVERVRESLGLNAPLPTQYLSWMSGVLRGDFGESLLSSQDVGEAIASRFPVTLSLTLVAAAIALLIGIPTGVIAALRPGTWLDRAATFVATIGLAIPNFWFGLVLAYVFAVSLRWFPATGYVAFGDDPLDWLRSIVLPAVALGTSAAATVARQTRSSMLDVLKRDYIRTAYAVGIPTRNVVLGYALKNAAIPIVTVIGFLISSLLAGAMIVEQVFGLPGLGSLAVTAVRTRNIPMVQGVVMYVTIAVVVVNLLVDLTYGWLNPKVRPG